MFDGGLVVWECTPGLVFTCFDGGRWGDLDFRFEGPEVADLRALGLCLLVCLVFLIVEVRLGAILGRSLT